MAGEPDAKKIRQSGSEGGVAGNDRHYPYSGGPRAASGGQKPNWQPRNQLNRCL